MKMHRVFQALLALILLACLSGEVLGQYGAPTSGYSTAVPTSGAAQSVASQSQFYQMLGGQAPSTHIGNPQPFDIAGNIPSNVYFSNQTQPVSYSQYQSNPTIRRTPHSGLKEHRTGHSMQ